MKDDDLPPFPIWLIMECPICGIGSDVNDWILTEAPCVSSSCSERTAAECPECDYVGPHAWLDGQVAWREYRR